MGVTVGGSSAREETAAPLDFPNVIGLIENDSFSLVRSYTVTTQQVKLASEPGTDPGILVSPPVLNLFFAKPS